MRGPATPNTLDAILGEQYRAHLLREGRQSVEDRLSREKQAILRDGRMKTKDREEMLEILDAIAEEIAALAN